MKRKKCFSLKSCIASETFMSHDHKATFSTPKKDYCTIVDYLVWLAGTLPKLS